MGDVDTNTEPVDGRAARRQRNIDSVLDVVIDMFAEESMFPTIDQVSVRSGLSLRSLYRYFADPGELLEAAIKRSYERMVPLSKLKAIGTGPLDGRIDDFVAMRLRLYDAAGPAFRASVVNAAQHPAVQDEMTRARNLLLDQFEKQFAPELAALKPSERKSVVASGDLLTQMFSVDHLRRHRGLSESDARAALTNTLRMLLS